ncbi:MAG TPA: DUF1588 domain-containing protein [Polyangiaceae bacterium]
MRFGRFEIRSRGSPHHLTMRCSIRPKRTTVAAWSALAGLALSLCACSGTIAGPDMSAAASGGGSGTPGAPSGGSGGGSSAGGAGSGALGSGAATSGGNAGTGSAAGGSGAVTSCTAADVAEATVAARIRRLTRLEMENTLGDLLGDDARVLANELEPDTLAIGYSTGDERSISANYVEELRGVAEAAAADLDGALESQLLVTSCFSSDASAADCARRFLEDFGARAYRRPLSNEELDGLLEVYALGRATAEGDDEESALRAGLGYGVRALLQSSSFVFRTELGEPGVEGERVALTPYEAASELSYTLIASPPDAELVASAASGALAQAGERTAQGQRLLDAHPERFARQAEHFIREWLSIDVNSPAWNKDMERYPTAGRTLKDALDQETTLFLRDWAAGASFPELLTTTRAFVSRDNASVYDLDSTSGDFVPVELDASRRAGILTLPAFLGSRAHADASSPVLRGIAVMRQLLCLEPPPIPDVVPPLPPADEAEVKTTRERYERHTSVPACAACHASFDPMGFAFEHYDALGQYRDEENGEPIDASGAIVGTASSDGPVADAVELANRLAESPEAQSCFVRHAYRFALGRRDTQAEACAIDDFARSFRDGELDVRRLLLALATSPATFERLPLAQDP